jgi:hypothetical protein
MIPFICPTCGEFNIDAADCSSCTGRQGEIPADQTSVPSA